MRFQVPQFIEVEDKIFGPLTVKQFIYLAGAGAVAFIFWKTMPNFIAIILGAPFVALGVALAFYKINNRPFVSIIESFFKYVVRNRLYIWKNKEVKIVKEEKKNKLKAEDLSNKTPIISGNKLKDIAWSLDIKESIYSDKSQR